MKTPEEIKSGLSACMTDGGCTVCPYHSMGSGAKCIPAMSSDAFAYVQELESHLAQANRERDAAVDAIHDVCSFCKGNGFPTDCERCMLSKYRPENTKEAPHAD